jgi:uncharacterized protein
MRASVSDEDVEYIKLVNNGKVAGLQEVAARNASGKPSVVRVASLVEGKPFPTLFWLIDPELVKRISGEEATGRIAEFQQRVNEDADLRASMEHDHREYIALRQKLTPPEMQEEICKLGYDQLLAERGIGGLEKYDRIRCFHTWYAAHLVQPNTIGRMLDALWQKTPLLPTKPMLEMKMSYKELCADPGGERERLLLGRLHVDEDKQRQDLVAYFSEARNFRKELLEAAELDEICSDAFHFDSVMDVGCSHGLTSLLMARLAGRARSVMWVDANVNCRAAQYSKRLGIAFHESVAKANVRREKEATLALIVNVCGPALLNVISDCREAGISLFCIVPCCGPDGVGYDDWVRVVQEAVGTASQLVALKGNLGRTAILST